MADTSKIPAFFGKLDSLENKHRVRFKRSCGKLLKETDTGTLQVFYRILPPETSVWEENLWFTAACIHCLWPAEETGRQPMQECIAGLKDTSDSFEKRFTGLLETLWDEILPATISTHLLIRKSCGKICSSVKIRTIL